MSSIYLIALGSNRPHHQFGPPPSVLRAAMEECAVLGTVTARSAIISSIPMGAAQRHFANAACVIDSEYDPPALLAGLQRLEREFGRRRGRRWGDRVLDLDIILWSGGQYSARAPRASQRGSSLTIPHREFGKRRFVLDPAASIAADWRDPSSGRSIAQINARLTHPRPLTR
ncbi:2-amino-4-hydroxy-6-hydroxymethyldihydropteridine diphosphokinase [Qipengyuania sp. ASV99]|uniref:2-amino-4-hydroxy-6- hydroxymethyldihydropteridine diphosphokinase n=1 Tax=Qipengyuania sp. ASV99 TaxID=3399681 RepID=UPI003A4C758A